MPDRRHRALGPGRVVAWLAGLVPPALLLLAASVLHAADPAPSGAPRVEHVSTHVWSMDDPDFGGFSGIEISDDGASFTALSDRATMRWGTLRRDDQGRILGLDVEGRVRLKDSAGKPLQPGWLGDSEGLAIAADGTIFVSFEGLTRVARFDAPDSPSRPLKRLPEFKTLQRNSSLEALAVMADGTLLTLPERSGALTRPFPVWRWRNGKWDQPFSIPRSGDWLAVGADIGPDGRLYLLERDFKGLLGFRSRLRRFDVIGSGDGIAGGRVLLESGPLQYDNLEGISVWHDGDGIRITLISDDNFGMFQRTELVEYRVRD